MLNHQRNNSSSPNKNLPKIQNETEISLQLKSKHNDVPTNSNIYNSPNNRIYERPTFIDSGSKSTNDVNDCDKSDLSLTKIINNSNSIQEILNTEIAHERGRCQPVDIKENSGSDNDVTIKVVETSSERLHINSFHGDEPPQTNSMKHQTTEIGLENEIAICTSNNHTKEKTQPLIVDLEINTNNISPGSATFTKNCEINDTNRQILNNKINTSINDRRRLSSESTSSSAVSIISLKKKLPEKPPR